MCDPASVSRYLYRLYEYGAEHGTVDHGEADCLSHLQVKTISWLGTTIAVNPSRGPRETNRGAEVHCDAACEKGFKDDFRFSKAAWFYGLPLAVECISG